MLTESAVTFPGSLSIEVLPPSSPSANLSVRLTWPPVSEWVLQWIQRRKLELLLVKSTAVFVCKCVIAMHAGGVVNKLPDTGTWESSGNLDDNSTWFEVRYGTNQRCDMPGSKLVEADITNTTVKIDRILPYTFYTFCVSVANQTATATTFLSPQQAGMMQ